MVYNFELEHYFAYLIIIKSSLSKLKLVKVLKNTIEMKNKTLWLWLTVPRDHKQTKSQLTEVEFLALDKITLDKYLYECGG